MTFGDTEIEKEISPIQRLIYRIVVSLRFLSVKKVLNIFLGTKFMLMCIMLAKMNAIRRDFDETKYMSFY